MSHTFFDFYEVFDKFGQLKLAYNIYSNVTDKLWLLKFLFYSWIEKY